jgi:hypothetical protein
MRRWGASGWPYSASAQHWRPTASLPRRASFYKRSRPRPSGCVASAPAPQRPSTAPASRPCGQGASCRPCSAPLSPETQTTMVCCVPRRTPRGPKQQSACRPGGNERDGGRAEQARDGTPDGGGVARTGEPARPDPCGRRSRRIRRAGPCCPAHRCAAEWGGSHRRRRHVLMYGTRLSFHACDAHGRAFSPPARGLRRAQTR